MTKPRRSRTKRLTKTKCYVKRLLRVVTLAPRSLIGSWCQPTWSAIPTRTWRKPARCLGYKVRRKKGATHMQKTSQKHRDEMDQVPQPLRDHAGGTDPGPRNIPLDRQNPDMLTPLGTDSGTLPNMKFSFALAHNRLQ